MTVAYACFRYKIDRETYKSFVYYFPGPADVPIIWNRAPEPERGEMGNAARTPAKEPTAAENGQTSQEEDHDKFYVATLEEAKKSGCSFLKIGYVALSVITIFKCIALIAVSVSSAIATKTFSIQQSGRLVAMIILAVTAGVTMSMVIYAMLAVFRKHTRPLHAAGAVLVVVVIIQSIICASSVNLTTDDEINLGRTLVESFKMAKEGNPRHVKLWSVTQSDLICCGVYGSDDYRSPSLPLYFAPDVPISCCPGYDPDRSELVQERQREGCKARRKYYTEGCSAPVVQLFRYTSSLVLSVTVLVIVFEVLLAVFAGVISRKRSEKKRVAVVEVVENPKATS